MLGWWQPRTAHRFELPGRRQEGDDMEQIGKKQESPSAGRTGRQAQTQPVASDASPTPDLSQVAAHAVAQTEGIPPDQARALFKDHLQYVESRTRSRMKDYETKHGTIAGFDYYAMATLYAESIKEVADDNERRKHSGRTDFKPVGIECSAILGRLYLANKWSKKVSKELTRALDFLTYDLRLPDEQMNEMRQAWQPVKKLLEDIHNQEDLIEMSFDRLNANLDSLIDEIRNET